MSAHEFLLALAVVLGVAAVTTVVFQRLGQPVVLGYSDDPWIIVGAPRFDDELGRFTLMSPEAGTAFSGVRQGVLPSVRVIEDGAVRTVIEAVLEYHESRLCLHYKLPKQGTELEIQARVHWNEKSQMLKLVLPTTFTGAACRGQTAYGVADLPANGDEAVAQKWLAAVSAPDGHHPSGHDDLLDRCCEAWGHENFDAVLALNTWDLRLHAAACDEVERRLAMLPHRDTRLAAFRDRCRALADG